MSHREENVRRAIQETVRERIDHARKTGGSTDTRTHETAAQEIARRNDRRHSDGGR